MTEKLFNISYVDYNSDFNHTFDVHPGVIVRATEEAIEAFIARVNEAAKVLHRLQNQVFIPGGVLPQQAQRKLEEQLKAEGLTILPLPKGGATMSAKEHSEYRKTADEINQQNRAYYVREQVLETQLRHELFVEQVAQFEALVKENLAGYEKEVQLIFACFKNWSAFSYDDPLCFEAKEAQSFEI